MKSIAGLSALILMAVLLAGVALAQEDVMTLKIEGLNNRPAVVFSHAKHAQNLECVRCHHDYDEFGNNKGGDGGNCIDCHGIKPSKENPVDITLAFHKNCKDCHVAFLEKGKKTGPVMCGECHKLGASAPPAAK